ncbi:PREDICTED: glutathione S-transferase T3-like [Brassica oleracea var. oleracea]|uniref:glutathione S-transferase T3-like n=1 Tax=Brassica oleracea var. oleracea TaxID=109376 RepID=UPI0006A6B5BD|nr:PREDICTED: glutathione S-transferase T3-like [Brassica oleracea var. oleracea]
MRSKRQPKQRPTTTLLRASPPASVVLSVRRPLETTTNDDCLGQHRLVRQKPIATHHRRRLSRSSPCLLRIEDSLRCVVNAAVVKTRIIKGLLAPFELSTKAPPPVSSSSNRQQDSALPEPCPHGPYASFPPVVELSSTQPPVFSTETSSFCEESPRERKERKKWSVSDDLVLISAWLNTSKDHVVGNEQKACAFWSRITVYYAASPKVERGQKREAIQCKQRWQKMNDLFNLHHAWEELKNDQKWCALATAKLDGRQSSSAKKRKCEDGGEEASSQATTNGDHPAKRLVGVKAAKGGGGKRPIGDQLSASEFQGMWSLKEKNLAAKERLKKMGLLESLIAKKEPLSQFEEALKEKLITEMLG